MEFRSYIGFIMGGLGVIEISILRAWGLGI